MYRLKNCRLLGILGLTIAIGSCTKTSSTTDVIGNWVNRSEFEGIARSEGVSFTINNLAYVSTGYDIINNRRLADLWSFDPVPNNGDGSWRQLAAMPAAAGGRSQAVGFSINDKGYIGTGYDGVNMLQDFWQYNPASNTWAQKANFGGTARYDAVGFGILGKGYITTGFDNNYLKDFWAYDTTSDSWTQKVSMGGFKRSAAVAWVYQNKAYVCTGASNGSSTTINDFWVFDPSATNYWTPLRDISNISTDSYDDAYAIVRSNATCFVMNGKAYVSCGENGALLTDTWEYDFPTDLWTKKTSFEGIARTGAIGFNVSDRGFVMTGRSGSQQFDDVREFFPTQDYNAND